MVVGPQGAGQHDAELIKAIEHFSVALSCNGEVREVGRGSNVLGSPLAAIAHLTSVLAKQRHTIPLQADELVTTGMQWLVNLPISDAVRQKVEADIL